MYFILCHDHCRGVFQCSDNFLSQFCDGILDCFNSSDEFTNQPGFKCNKCVVPQNDLLYMTMLLIVIKIPIVVQSNNVLNALINRLLLLDNQMCDGVGDCCDMFDECLCDTHFDTEI